jgi:hypothetical protein
MLGDYDICFKCSARGIWDKNDKGLYICDECMGEDEK